MKIHNASNENASVTLKPKELEEITWLGYNFKKIVRELLNTIVELHDNGENCPMCGTEYENKDAYLDMTCANTECIFAKAEQVLKNSILTLGQFRLACLGMGIEDNFYKSLNYEPIDLA
jgi:hypothetical protein